MRFDNLGDWLRDGLLPTALIVIGAALIRPRRPMGKRSLPRRARRVGTRHDRSRPGRVGVGEATRAGSQAAAWALVSLTYFVAACSPSASSASR